MTNILNEADRLVDFDRGNDYGDPKIMYKRMARLWSAIIGYDLTPEQVILCMIATKLGRESLKHKRDNLVDLAGYAKLLAIYTDED